MGNSQETQKNKTKPTIKKNIVLVGDSSVGKTTIINQLVQKSQYLKPKKETQFYGSIGLGSTRDYSLEVDIWDTPGERNGQGVVGEVLEEADVVIMVYASYRGESFENLRRHQALVVRHCKRGPIVIIVRNSLQEGTRVQRSEYRSFRPLNVVGHFDDINAMDSQSINSLFVAVRDKIEESL